MDKVGNTYVIEPDPLNPARPFKRMIEAKDTIYDPSRYHAPSRGVRTLHAPCGDVLLSRPHCGYHRDCLRSVPALWRSWLNFRREEPPTEKELEAYEAKQVKSSFPAP